MKKILALLLAVMMLASVLVACNGGNTNNNNSGNAGNTSNSDPFYGEDNISLLVWAPDAIVSLTKELCNDFIAQYPDKTITIDVQAQAESEAATQAMNDLDKAADVFGFACDQLTKLVQAKALAPVVDDYLEDVKSRNTDFSVSVATKENTVYAYPETGENGLYLVYDKSVVTDEDAKTLEGVLAACQKAGRKFIFNVGDGFSGGAIPFTGGMSLTGLTEDGTQIFNDYNKDEVLDSMEAFSALFHQYSDTFMDAAPARIASGMDPAELTVGAGFDGSWDTPGVTKALGDNFGAAKLPTINIKGTDKQIYCFNGGKLIGVNSHSKFPEASQVLANYLTQAAAQTKRMESNGWLPSNKEVQESDAVKNSPALNALSGQTQFSVPMTDVAATFWTPIGTMCAALYKADDNSREALSAEFDKAMANVLDE